MKTLLRISAVTGSCYLRNWLTHVISHRIIVVTKKAIFAVAFGAHSSTCSTTNDSSYYPKFHANTGPPIFKHPKNFAQWLRRVESFSFLTLSPPPSWVEAGSLQLPLLVPFVPDWQWPWSAASSHLIDQTRSRCEGAQLL